MTTRLIVKNLPSNCTEASLRKFFSKHGTITDASLKYTKEGKFRKFAFVGFLDEESAKKAVNQTNQAFMGTSKLQVEECRPFGDTDKPRAWSLYSKDSSAYKRKHGDKEKDQNIQTPSESEPNVKKKKKDEKYQQFLEAKGVKTEKEQKFVVSKEEKQLLDELLEGVHGDTSLSLTFTGLPSSIKLKNIKEWLNPIRVKALKISRTEETAAAFVTFNRPPDVRKALERDSQFLGGYKVNIRKVDIGNEEEDKRSNNENFSKNPEYSPEKEEEVIREKILDTGRLFLRNLPFATTEDDLHFVFKKYGEVGEVQVITNKTDGRCKGFAIVEFVFPESAVAAYSAMDGRIFKGRMMHILPGEEKREKEEEEEDVKEKGGDLATTSSFKRQKEEKQKANAQKSHSWNALFLGANAVADTLAERLSVSKSDLLTGESGQSAGVRMALAETRLVQETRDFF
ncbi:unnamed protein product [Caenorhabditis auriculariae]|uniref:RRM domain-containing protein n=1 Tax=Caenorhabditis auriculariae TaxID=2777116 RepID=A0A8S1HJS6_9PELO|nr:unnamed protein product [Caenorhabditis auriculariae]